jgi:hypothetical protein
MVHDFLPARRRSFAQTARAERNFAILEMVIHSLSFGFIAPRARRAASASYSYRRRCAVAAFAAQLVPERSWPAREL